MMSAQSRCVKSEGYRFSLMSDLLAKLSDHHHRCGILLARYEHAGADFLCTLSPDGGIWLGFVRVKPIQTAGGHKHDASPVQPGP